MKRSTLPAAALLAGAALALSGCVANTPTGSADTGAGAAAAGSGVTQLTVDSSADACTVSAATAPSGTVSFHVTNSTDQVTEFYLLADDGLRIVGEVENVSPGIERDLVLTAQPGSYYTVCKPGMVGDGVGRAPFTVTGDQVALAGDAEQQGQDAAATYLAYVKDQVGRLLPATQEFADAYLAGDDDRARARYPTARAYYERVEPVAESFGDLDPEIDFREADVEPGTEWTGWHRIEKDLWQPSPDANGGDVYTPLGAADRAHFAQELTTDTQKLYDAVHADGFSVDISTVSNGAVGLMDEVASGKITGEEEIWSHTDLWDFQANLEGARVAYEGVRDIVAPKDPQLVATLDAQFASLEKELAAYGSLEKGFTTYDELTTDQVKGLADGVNALAEPLSKLTGALVG
ncbi:iron uptake system protein EfeO [Clavibacter michiganensis]|uniref:iron uptake system protein EfeO n=1 Tax=Clavibacter michiganensis TaxID=28447 RepID=UPI000A3B0ACB|nr:iron uptake system protein EfeO [Clavibacter michiganensis]MWJ36265.1 EfeM/EfeO family lipoprotein [Clavibacter michiganensis subsp. michiganensis]OUD88994.1 Efem/EfeO family lipoprotein precursor [Clavibacter michiganensis subsp. michiganensis]OUE13670.1 Efem/EfeO family lipoprotein precursor [Clavibacter michiganensis subsp. michiganensis]